MELLSKLWGKNQRAYSYVYNVFTLLAFGDCGLYLYACWKGLLECDFASDSDRNGLFVWKRR